MARTDQQQGGNRNREKDPNDSCQLRATDHRQNHHHRVELQTLTDQSRIDYVILDHSKDEQKRGHDQRRLPRCQPGDQKDDDEEQEWPKHRNELEHPGGKRKD